MNKNVKDVIDILRRDVPMPWIYPKLIKNSLRWEIIIMNCSRFREEVCPLGLHNTSNNFTPIGNTDFYEHIFTDIQIKDFISWWDNLKDPKYAFKRIWL